MDPIASFSGLASGIDFRSMVDQIIQVDSRPIQLYQRQIDDATARSQAWATFRSGVQALETQAADLAGEFGFRRLQHFRDVPGRLGQRTPERPTPAPMLHPAATKPEWSNSPPGRSWGATSSRPEPRPWASRGSFSSAAGPFPWAPRIP